MRAAELAALELEQDEENPGPRASMGQFQRVVPLDLSLADRRRLGGLDSGAPRRTIRGRSRSSSRRSRACGSTSNGPCLVLMSLPPVKSMSAARMLRARPASLRGGGLGCARYRVRDN